MLISITLGIRRATFCAAPASTGLEEDDWHQKFMIATDQEYSAYVPTCRIFYFCLVQHLNTTKQFAHLWAGNKRELKEAIPVF